MVTTGATTDLVEALSPVVATRGLDLVDVEVHGAEITVFVDREGGVGLDELGEATRDVSSALDDLDPMPGRYTLSVSSPGLERRLRTPAHFARALGETVTLRVLGGTAEVKRMRGVLESADDTGCTLVGPEVPEGRQHVRYEDVERARTVFEWGPEPGSRGPAKGSPRTASAPKTTTKTSERVKRP